MPSLYTFLWPTRYTEFTRVSLEDFDFLLVTIAPYVTGSSHFQKPVPPSVKLAVTLRYLVTGDLIFVAVQLQVGFTALCLTYMTPEDAKCTVATTIEL